MRKDIIFMNIDTNKRFTLRIDNQIYETVKQSAKQNRRSAAKEIEYALSIYYSTFNKKETLTCKTT